MKTYHRCLYWVATGFIFVAASAVAANDEDVADECISTSQENAIVLNADGNYVLTHDGCVTIWEPMTKIDPEVIGHMTFNASTQTISYDYQIHNNGKSRQPIAGMRLDGSSASFNVRFPPGWGGHAENFYSPRRDLNGRVLSGGFNVGISRWPGAYGVNSLKGVQPGAMLGGIGFDNADLPGVGNVYLWGATAKDRRPSFHDEILDKEFNQITRANSYVPRLAPIPMIPVSTPFDPKAPRKTPMPGTPVIPVTGPFDAANVLTHIQKHLDTDLIKLNLVEPVVAGQLDRLFQVAIAAAKTNNLTAARTYIQDMYKLIEREQGGNKAIDQLAAKVLIFDLKYVEKRIQ